MLPIEFAKISSGNRLTLVIKPEFDLVQTLWAMSSCKTLEEARHNLMEREGSDDINSTGYYNFCDNTFSIRRVADDILEELLRWNGMKNFDAVIWTDLGPNFFNRTRREFTIQNVVTFLNNLPASEYADAKQYILNTPIQVQTRFRNQLESFLATK
jgi:hypothetical protein